VTLEADCLKMMSLLNGTWQSVQQMLLGGNSSIGQEQQALHLVNFHSVVHL